MDKSLNFQIDNFISEKDVNKIKYEMYKRHIENLQEKEKFIMNLPYSEDTPR